MEGKDLGHLKLDAVIGINGGSKRCILMHPDNQRLIFALGYSIVVRDLISSSDTFLCGHDNCVTCIAISKDGKYLASGQVTHPGFVADIIIWSLDDARELGRLRYVPCTAFIRVMSSQITLQHVLLILYFERSAFTRSQ